VAEPKTEDWQRIYQEALTETDPGRLLAKITAAESMLFSRLKQMHHERAHREEALAIYDAIHCLRLLRCDLYAQKKRDELALVWKRSA
jgi:hypothetical protein